MRKAPCGHTWGGGFEVEVAKWQSGKVSGFCHLDFAVSLFKSVIQPKRRLYRPEDSPGRQLGGRDHNVE